MKVILFGVTGMVGQGVLRGFCVCMQKEATPTFRSAAFSNQKVCFNAK
ncbi:MAG TPA: hypothetical protein VN426_18390 [Syntrophomonadaceae bacterium]|nr:hypothetical protein [Syntrophomonadaceae bacterium]